MSIHIPQVPRFKKVEERAMAKLSKEIIEDITHRALDEGKEYHS